MTPILSLTLAPPRMATNGFCGGVQRFAEISSSFFIEQAGGALVDKVGDALVERVHDAPSRRRYSRKSRESLARCFENLDPLAFLGESGGSPAATTAASNCFYFFRLHADVVRERMSPATHNVVEQDAQALGDPLHADLRIRLTLGMAEVRSEDAAASVA